MAKIPEAIFAADSRFELEAYNRVVKDIMNKEDSINQFRDLINEFKSPYLLRLEQEPLNKEESIQDVDQIHSVLSHLDRLYALTKKIILGKMAELTKLEDKAVLSVFEKKGILDALNKDPTLKEDFLYYLNLDLKTYPFTRSTGHLRKLEVNNVESHQREIVQNLE